MGCTTGMGNDRPPSPNEYQDTLEFFLCRACRYLSKQQLEAIVRHDQSKFTDTTNILLEWYKNHLKEDYVCEQDHKHRPDMEMTINELKRIGVASKQPNVTVYPY
jgi:hypothetical protein